MAPIKVNVGFVYVFDLCTVIIMFSFTRAAKNATFRAYPKNNLIEFCNALHAGKEFCRLYNIIVLMSLPSKCLFRPQLEF